MDQEPVSRPRNPDGSFAKGGPPPPPSAHRKKGVANKITADIREGAIAGFARHGSNGRGEGGFAGFCFYLARKHPKAAARIVEKLLPLNVNATGLGGGPSISQVNIISVPTDTYLSSEDIAKLRSGGMQTIEHTPPIEPPPAEEPIDREFEPQTERERRLLAELEALSPEQLLERAKQAGFTDVDSIPIG